MFVCESELYKKGKGKLHLIIYCKKTKTKKTIEVATVTSPTGFEASSLHFDRRHLGFLEPEMMTSGHMWTRGWS